MVFFNKNAFCCLTHNAFIFLTRNVFVLFLLNIYFLISTYNVTNNKQISVVRMATECEAQNNPCV